MKRFLSALLLAVAVQLVAAPALAPIVSGSVAYAETSEKELMEQIKKVKKMVSDLEMQLKSKKMMMDAAKRDEAMRMLSDVESMIKKIQAP